MHRLAWVMIVVGVARNASASPTHHLPWPQGWQGMSATAKAEGARVSLTDGGPWLDKRVHDDLEVHDNTGANPRFELEEWGEHGGIALALYAERAGLETFIPSGTDVFATEAAAAAGKPLGEQTPGWRPNLAMIPTAVTPAGNRLVQVVAKLSWESGSVELRGFVPARHLTAVHRISTGKSAREPNAQLPGTFELLDSPGGKPFASRRSEWPVEVTRLAKKGRFSLVEVHGWMVGWVPSAKLDRLPPPPPAGGSEEGGVEGGVAGGVLGGIAKPKRGGIPEGTLLYDKPSGTVVGAVRRRYTGAIAARRGKWRRYDLATRLGNISVWVDSAAPVAATDEHKPRPRETGRPPIVGQSTLEPLRLTGTKDIAPDAATARQIAADGKTRVMAVYKLCLSNAGKVSSANLIKSSGYTIYDEAIAQAIEGWSFEPYQVDGRPSPVCSAFTFMHRRD